MKQLLIFITKHSLDYSGTGIALLRIFISALMLTHGWQKLSNFTEVSASFDGMLGMGGVLVLSLVVFAEFFCSIALIFGFLTRLASIPLIINMGVAVFMAHAGQPLSGRELPVIYLGVYVVLFFTGGGCCSIDQWMHKALSKENKK